MNKGRHRSYAATSSSTSSTATRTNIQLVCLVHGEPPSSCFKVTIGNHEDGDELRKLIKKINEHDFAKFAARKLKLWVVDIPYNSLNISDYNVDIVNVLHGREFPILCKVGDIFTEQPVKDHIHIIIELPALNEAGMEGELELKKTIVKFTETTQQFIDYIDRQAKRSKVSLSSIDQTHLDELLNHLQFRRATSIITVSSADKDFDERFVWDERNEDQHAKDVKDDHDQVCRRGYMSYLSDNISISSKFIWYDPKPKKDLLNINDSSLPYSISGTTDVLVMDESFYRVLDYRSGIQAGFELKKEVQDSDTNQAIAELIVTNLVSNHAVFIVLTDLNNTWIFYWLTNDNLIMMSRTNSRDALAIIEMALAEDPKVKAATTTIDINFPIGMRCNYFRRLSNLQYGEAFENEVEGLDLFLNRPKVNFEFEDDIANMKDMFDEMTEKEITDWKIKRALRLLEDTPGFQLDKNYMDMYS
ncbi:13939_t:CDS:2 [Cetraspora pellucida]|uniref:13939_t:CDS:1 n=1 Tax=Cetraspora pellucida TaxID=1433469 RepID=A0A9N9GV71_9GLOM|nr:13939_t:CDS:2 [Cetraspora pellucida]